ncbi:MAG: type II toxin-antitoxin system RelE/ParE family toxin [Oscillospiraceae bacterium]|nr:type II toxin-antitoxin system RelE/ParE family toxin [Oscillospiraceae bacterium]
MEREFVIMPEFDRTWEELGLTDEELIKLENEIGKNPKFGKVIPGTGGIRKIRFALKSKGKSGGIRVLYIDIFVTEKIILLGAYPKNIKENLSEAEKKVLKKITE